MSKKSLLQNYRYVVLSNRNKEYYFVKDEEELSRWVDDSSISEDDIVITLDEQFIRTAVKHNFIELK